MLKMLNVGKQNKACRRESGLFVILGHCDQTLFCRRGGEGKMRWGLSWCTASAGKQRSCLSGEAGWVHHVRTFSPQGALTRKQAHECGNASIVPHLPSREDDFTSTPGSMTSFLLVSAMFYSLFRTRWTITALAFDLKALLTAWIHTC